MDNEETQLLYHFFCFLEHEGALIQYLRNIRETDEEQAHSPVGIDCDEWISATFEWSVTEQGHDFWQKLHQKWERLDFEEAEDYDHLHHKLVEFFDFLADHDNDEVLNRFFFAVNRREEWWLKEPMDWIDYSIYWTGTKEGHGFWSEINDDWREKLRKDQKLDRKVDDMPSNYKYRIAGE